VIRKTWAFVIEPIATYHTRLLVQSYSDGLLASVLRLSGRALQSMGFVDRALSYLIDEPLHFVMEREMLRGIKRRGEG
jgi:hypothetical protein